MHLKSTYLFIKQIGDDVQVKVNEDLVNKASWQLDLEGQMPIFCLQKVHAQTWDECEYFTVLN